MQIRALVAMVTKDWLVYKCSTREGIIVGTRSYMFHAICIVPGHCQISGYMDLCVHRLQAFKLLEGGLKLIICMSLAG